jgi:hypothetical protein
MKEIDVEPLEEETVPPTAHLRRRSVRSVRAFGSESAACAPLTTPPSVRVPSASVIDASDSANVALLGTCSF